MSYMVIHVRQGWVSTRFMQWSRRGPRVVGRSSHVSALRRSKRSRDCKVPRQKPGTALTSAGCKPSIRLRGLPGVPEVLRGERGSWIACEDPSQLPLGPACANATSLPFACFPRVIPKFLIDHSCCSAPSHLRGEVGSLSALATFQPGTMPL